VGRGTLAITAPPGLTPMAVTDDVDIWPQHNETAALDECNFELGEASKFHEQHGFYIERVGSWTLLTQPPGWEDRATLLRCEDKSLLVLGLMDLLYNKLEANRRKDRDFLKEALACKLVEADDLKGFVLHFAPNSEAADSLLGTLKDVVASLDAPEQG